MSKPVGPRQICTFQCANDVISIEERQTADLVPFQSEIGDKNFLLSAVFSKHWWVAVMPVPESDGRIIAYGDLRPNGVDYEVTCIVVPDFRNQGLGRLMLRCADNMARRYRISSLIMHVTSDAARKIANSEGWDDVGNDVVRREIK